MKIKQQICLFLIIWIGIAAVTVLGAFEMNRSDEETTREILSSYAETITSLYSTNVENNELTLAKFLAKNSIVFISDNQGKVLYSSFQGIRKNEFLSQEIISATSFESSVAQNRYTFYSYRTNPSFIVFAGFAINYHFLWIKTILLSILVSIALTFVFIFLHKRFTLPIILNLHKFAENMLENRQNTPDFTLPEEFAVLKDDLLQMDARIKMCDNSQKTFLQNISHEIKTPLMSIQSYSEAILDGLIDKKEMNESLTLIITECNRLKNLVNELIFYGKLQSTTFMFDFKLHNLKDVMIDAIESVGGLAIKKGITFDYTPTSLFMQMDEDRMKQALMNIFSNCIRHARSIVSVDVLESNNRVEIKIFDDGDGFSNDDLNHLFTRFSKGKTGETGLGLSISKSIFDKHQGSIQAMNHPEGGALFIITLKK